MKKRSNRNRHTGHINAYKARILASGKRIQFKDRAYYIQRLCNNCGLSAVREP